MLRTLLVLICSLFAASFSAACGGVPCSGQNDCPFGSFCVNEGGATGAGGVCKHECISFEDCEQPDLDVADAVCTNEGRCRIQPKPPRLIVFEPQTDMVYPEGTRTIRVTGEVETAAEMVAIEVSPTSENGCAGGLQQGMSVRNPNPGRFQRMAFAIDDVELDPGRSELAIAARIAGASRAQKIDVELACPGCARIMVTEPTRFASALGLELPILRGSIQPAVQLAAWRVRSPTGDILDGVLPVDAAGNFSIDHLPLFAGLNRVEVVASGVGSGIGEARCSTIVTSAIGSESGLRVLLSWDGANSDLDLNIIGPSGRFGDPGHSLSPRAQRPSFGGSIEDDADGFGPEVARVPAPPDGVYGLIVEPIIDGGDFGSDAVVRILFDGRSVVRGPIGPRHVTSLDGRLWVAGKMIVDGSSVTFESIDELVSAANPPTRPPSDWPAFY